MATPVLEPELWDGDYDDPPRPPSSASEPECRICGCSEDEPCLGADGLPCHWVTPTLCSACLEP